MVRSYMILVVDDEPTLLQTYSSVLSASGHFVWTAGDGYEAIRMLVERHVDLLIADIHMPGLSGLHLGAQAKLMCPGIHVMYITGFGCQPDQMPTRRIGIVMKKPIRPAELLQAIEREMSVQS